MTAKEAMYYVKLPGGKVECHLCPHTCVINPGGRGVCRVRENREGRLYTRNYGRCSSLALDPIEKSPSIIFIPAALSFRPERSAAIFAVSSARTGR